MTNPPSGGPKRKLPPSMPCLAGLSWHWILTHALCSLALLIQLGSMVWSSYLHPTNLYTSMEVKQMDDVVFPAVFKICASPGFNNAAIKDVGYRGVSSYFMGKIQDSKQKQANT